MFYEKIKNKRGITLIALVVTIVVLLILAGVTIAMLTGENGIINQAKNAKEESLKSELEELVDLTLMEYKTDKETGKTTDLGNLLNSKVGKDFDAVTEDDNSYIVEKNGYEVIVNKDGIRITDADKKEGVRPKLKIINEYSGSEPPALITIKIENASELGTIDQFELFDPSKEKVTEKTNETNKKIYEVTKEGKYTVIVSATTNGIKRVTTKVIEISFKEIFSEIYTTTQKYIDKDGNVIWIPKGYAVGKTDNINNVYQGVVITDKIDENNMSIGNEFVWIPIGDIKVNSSTTTIELGRYSFGGDWKPNLMQSGTNYTEEVLINGEWGAYCIEGEAKGNQNAKNLKDFIDKAYSRNGFFISRYLGRQSENTQEICFNDKSSLIDITQIDASNKCKIFSKDNNIQSDLINSYASDTSIAYMNKIGMSVDKILADKTNIKNMDKSFWSTETAYNGGNMYAGPATGCYYGALNFRSATSPNRLYGGVYARAILYF